MSEARSYTHDYALKTGMTLVRGSIQAGDSDDDDFFAAGFNTHIGKRWEDFELNFSSYIYFGGVTSLSFTDEAADNEEGEVKGKAFLRNTSFGPTLKYFLPWSPLEGWKIYTGLGAMMSLHSLKLSTTKFIGDKRVDKVEYASRGGILLLGIEQFFLSKTELPLYAEIAVQMADVYERTTSDLSTETRVETNSKQEKKFKMYNKLIMLSVGVALF